MTTPDFTPKTNTVELHITYRCNLRCAGCNRALFLNDINVPDMTLEDIDSLIEQMLAIKKRFTVFMLGGEPTLHPDILIFVNRLLPYCRCVRITSNGLTEDSRMILNWAEAAGAKISRGSFKRNNYSFFDAFIKDTFIDPSDFGIRRQTPCYWHSTGGWGCGFSADSLGYTVCAIGGVIDSLRGLGVRTKRIADLFDRDFALWQTTKLCEHCGAFLQLDKKYSDKLHIIDRVCVSDSWFKVSRYYRQQ